MFSTLRSLKPAENVNNKKKTWKTLEALHIGGWHTPSRENEI